MFKKLRRFGFTLVELLVIISVIGILASVTSLGYINWRKSAYDTQVKNDLKMAANAMENERNFSDTGYPTMSLPVSFKQDNEVNISLENRDPSSFCIEASHKKDASIKFYITNTSSEPIVGNCH